MNYKTPIISARLSVMLVLLLFVLAFDSMGCTQALDTKTQIEWRSGNSPTGELRPLSKDISILLSGLEEKDSGKIKQIFSKAVHDKVGDITLEKGAEYLISIFEGDLVKVSEIGIAYHNSSEGWKRRAIQSGRFSITTTDDSYKLSFEYYAKDGITPEYKGMYHINLFRETGEIRGAMRDDVMGIYVPNQIEVADKNIPHEYRNAYGTFTVPAGYYLDDWVFRTVLDS